INSLARSMRCARSASVMGLASERRFFRAAMAGGRGAFSPLGVPRWAERVRPVAAESATDFEKVRLFTRETPRTIMPSADAPESTEGEFQVFAPVRSRHAQTQPRRSKRHSRE